jgi:hypothetical protein
MNKPSPEAADYFRRIVRAHDQYFALRMELHAKYRSELLSVVVQGLNEPGGALAAFELIAGLDEEEKKSLLPHLLGFCSTGYAGKAKAAILSLPKAWLLQHLEASAEEVLAQNDYLDWVNLLSLFGEVDDQLAQRLARRAAAHPDVEIQQEGEEYLKAP